MFTQIFQPYKIMKLFLLIAIFCTFINLQSKIYVLYKQRWQIEIFFRDIKQLLHIKTFIGTSENAVKIQIWTALITILILKYLKSIAKYNWQLSNLVAFIRLNIFVKINLQFWLDKPFEQPPETPKNYYQGVLFWN